MLYLAGFLGLALFLWYVSFALSSGTFWFKLAFSAAGLAVLSFLVQEKENRPKFIAGFPDILIGAASAAVLYGMFRLGSIVLAVILPASSGQIEWIYARGDGVSLTTVSLLLLFITSPAEEIFWRGYVQKQLTRKLPPVTGVVLCACFYSVVHIWTFNPTLLLAAFIAGLFWGFLYLWRKNLTPVIISHALWTWSIFILFPVT